MNHNRTDTAPAGAGRCAIAAGLIAAAMCWPLLLTGEVFVFFDTGGYFSAGDKIIDLLADMISPTGTVAADSLDVESDVSFLRSFGYAGFAAGLDRLGGPLLLALMQGWMAVFVALTLLPARALTWGAALAVVPLALTTLPWFTVFAMPDILAAVIVGFGAVLWRTFDALTPLHKSVLVLLACAASLMHYGNPPLALGFFALVLLGRALERRLTLAVVLAAALPVLTGPLVNLGASAVVLDNPSTAPKRLPILLARSIEDGPAAWYLADACARQEALAICAAFDGAVPEDMTTFLWSQDGIKSLSVEEMRAVRAEEGRVLAAAFFAYPVAQTWSLSRNALRQLHSVGLAKINAAPDLRSNLRAGSSAFSTRLLAVFDRLVDWTTLAGVLALLPLLIANRTYIAPVALICVGLLLNALIFGGLSAPDDRYQARVVWILPFLALGFGYTEWQKASVSYV